MRGSKSDQPKPLEKADFVSALGLVTRSQAVSLKKADPDIEIIEVEESVPQTPTTPRTPKSLISQLSRDASPPPVVNKNLGIVKLEPVDSDNESEVSEKGEEERKVPKSQKLFTIDLCSLLGQRVKKHLDVLTDKPGSSSEESKEKFNNYEAFCHTPKKTNVREKLRDRNATGYPVSFRKRLPKYTHLYTFNKHQRKERYLVLKTGLTCRARALKRLVKPCSVKLKRVSKEVIKKWGESKPRPINQFIPHQVMVAGQKFPTSPVYMKDLDLQRLLCLKMPGGAMQAYSVKLPQSNNTTVVLSPPSSPRSSSNTSPTLIGPLVITPNRPKTTLSPQSSVLQSLLSRPLSQPPLAVRANSPPQRLLQQGGSGLGRYRMGPKSFLQDRRLQQEKHSQEDDCISISSDESSGYERTKKRAASPSSSQGPTKRPRTEEAPRAQPAALLFRCHLCNAALTCKQNARQVIQGHFANLHKVFNIDLIEHEDARGNKVMSIVEVNSPMSSSPGSPQSLVSPSKGPIQRNSLWQKPGPVVDLTEEDDDEVVAISTERVDKVAPKKNVKPISSSPARQSSGQTVKTSVKPQLTSSARQTPSPGQASKSSEVTRSPEGHQTKQLSTPHVSSPQSSSPMTRAARKLFNDSDVSARRSRRLQNGPDSVAASPTVK